MARDERDDVAVELRDGDEYRERAVVSAYPAWGNVARKIVVPYGHERYVPHEHLVDLERQLAEFVSERNEQVERMFLEKADIEHQLEAIKNRIAEVAAFGFQSLASNENPTVRAMANSLEQLAR